MATFTIKATICVDGRSIKTKEDATNELVVMIGDYEGGNSESEVGITIRVESVEEEKQTPLREAEECPFCGSLNTTEHRCHDCGRYISEDDRIIEPIRHKLSALCMDKDATEEHPYRCDVLIGWLHTFDEFVDEPHVVGIFEANDVVYVVIKEFEEPWDLDSLPTSDIVNIAETIGI